MGNLNATQVRALKEPGRYSDGDGLMLNVKDGGSKSWLLRIQHDGKRREFGLGSLKDVSLADAREKAGEIRKQVRQGADPVAEKQKQRERVPTFREAAKAVHKEHKRGWKNGKHQAQWLATLETYAFPAIGDMSVEAIEGRMVRDVLANIWLEKPETARRVRQRIGAVLDYAYSKGWRTQEAPMRSVTKGLPRQPRKTGRFEAMPYSDVPDFLEKLRERDSMGRLALEALILTAARSGEIRGATWDEIDLDTALWTIPGKRMKAGKAHTVPLSPATVEVFKRAAALRLKGSELVFYGQKPGRPLSDMTLLKVLRDMELPFTVHGFRSAFRDWAAEETSFPGEVAEAALAHAIPNKVEAAYRRTEFLEKRRSMMEAWGRFSTGAPVNVLPLTVTR
ncbi:integrase arm-type DNA-binding domain-containing protein [Emcibacter sp. SYSU 3D8]|uniref:tyrosine-type recombinase/integrase n=1 Tax=Emcibacter sp. SYSU 3D8 TaxID=3133969 RepID=UPI0031FE91B3